MRKPQNVTVQINVIECVDYVLFRGSQVGPLYQTAVAMGPRRKNLRWSRVGRAKRHSSETYRSGQRNSREELTSGPLFDFGHDLSPVNASLFHDRGFQVKDTTEPRICVDLTQPEEAAGHWSIGVGPASDIGFPLRGALTPRG